MKISFLKSSTYDFVWPQTESFPEEEKIILHCKKISHEKRVEIEDGQFALSAQATERRRKRDAVSTPQVKCQIGSTKWKKIEASVVGWDNVLDDEGDPIRFTLDKLKDLVSMNGGQPLEVAGHIELELLEKIDEENNFAEKSSIDGVSRGKSD